MLYHVDWYISFTDCTKVKVVVFVHALKVYLDGGIAPLFVDLSTRQR